MIAAIVITVLCNIALVALIAYIGQLQAREREGWAKERSELLNRIQAPETAVAESIEADFDGLSYVPIDDDKHWQAEQERILDA